MKKLFIGYEVSSSLGRVRVELVLKMRVDWVWFGGGLSVGIFSVRLGE